METIVALRRTEGKERLAERIQMTIAAILRAADAFFGLRKAIAYSTKR